MMQNDMDDIDRRLQLQQENNEKNIETENAGVVTTWTCDGCNKTFSTESRVDKKCDQCRESIYAQLEKEGVEEAKDSAPIDYNLDLRLRMTELYSKVKECMNLE